MADYKFTFALQRKGGNKSLKQGNEMISSNDRMHYAVEMKINKHLREIGRYVVLSEKGLTEPIYSPDKPCDVLVIVNPPSRRRIDPANFYPTVKPLIDGMTDANMWTDDNAEIVQSVKFELGEVTDDKKYHLDILIKGVEKMKVKIFSNLFISDLEKEINDFIKDKKIKDIKNFSRKDYASVIVMYEED